MSAEVINGKELAQDLRDKMKVEVEALQAKGVHPHLTVILVGDDPASKSYVSGKEKAAKEIGISSEVIRMGEQTTESELLEKIETLNGSEHVNGILVQLPLPANINEARVFDTNNIKKKDKNNILLQTSMHIVLILYMLET